MFVSYSHSTHSQWKIDEITQVKFYDNSFQCVKVKKINKKLDLVWLKLENTTHKMIPPALQYSLNSDRFYYMLGFSSRSQLDDTFSISNGLIPSENQMSLVTLVK